MPPASALERNFVMSTQNRVTELARVVLLLLAAVVAGCARTAVPDDSYFFGLATPTPMVHVPMAGVASYTQLIEQLQSQGYTDIKVTPLSANSFDPRPELMHPDLVFTSVDDEEAQDTPVHFGWNGTAAKNGQIVEVYVLIDQASRRKAGANPNP
jgi:hypothetical protein